ncbi:glycoside hydrolase family 6 protein [Streptomyces sp. NPDC005336]|uniref:glycoside hydrolase family 6 protein n=1 Tax=unclassified Streptomyces TaxID=2593676 RepID=UPI0033B3CB4C
MGEKGVRKTMVRRCAPAVVSTVLLLPLSGCLGMFDQPVQRGGLWVNPDSPAARRAREQQREGRSGDAALIRRIAEEPVAEWLGPAPRDRVRFVVDSAAHTGSTPVLVAYHIPFRDCGRYSAGGALDGSDYRNWIRQVANGIGVRKAMVVVEPDAVAQVVDGCVPAALRAPRLALLRDAVTTFAALPRTRVYLDAGNADWIEDPARLVKPLKDSGIDQADGFSLNVSNFQPTAASERYGHELSAALGGAHFVIDTSRNGNGPLKPGGAARHGIRAGEYWCNPPGRALGEPPSTSTGDPEVDAYLWIKRPGESDGTCNGGPAAGRWWTEYALDLARNTLSAPHAGNARGPGA